MTEQEYFVLNPKPFGVVYLARNLVNQKAYVGQTTNFERRKEKHIKESTAKNPKLKFQQAIKKYGIDSFSWEIIDIASSREELNEKEIYWIKELNSLAKNGEGYNIHEGGFGGNTFLGKNKEDMLFLKEKLSSLWTEERKKQYGKLVSLRWSSYSEEEYTLRCKSLSIACKLGWSKRSEENIESWLENRRTTLENLSEEEKQQHKENRRLAREKLLSSKEYHDALVKGHQKRTNEEKQITKLKLQKAWAEKSEEEMLEIIEKRKETNNNKSEEEKNDIIRRLKEAREAWSEERKTEIYNGISIRVSGANHPLARVVRCIETEEIFYFLKEAAEKIYGNPRHYYKITRSIKNKETVKGFTWIELCLK